MHPVIQNAVTFLEQRPDYKFPLKKSVFLTLTYPGHEPEYYHFEKTIAKLEAPPQDLSNTVVVTTSADTLSQIAERKANPLVLFCAGKIKIQGIGQSEVLSLAKNYKP